MMTYKQFSKLLERDGGRCYHCGAAGDNLVPQHRINRGMGGSKERERLSNIITLCSIVNGLLESDADVARLGRDKGWKRLRGSTKSPGLRNLVWQVVVA